MKVILLTLPVAVLLAACSTNQEPLGPDFGNAVRHNKAAHIINPTPTYDSLFGHDGPRMALGHDRYRTGTVIQPRTLSTTSEVIDSGGSE